MYLIAFYIDINAFLSDFHVCLFGNMSIIITAANPLKQLGLTTSALRIGIAERV